MTVELLIKTAAVCVPAALLAGLLKKDSPVMALLIALAAGCVILYSALGALGELMDFLGELSEAAGMSGAVLGVLLRVLGIALLGRMAGDLCRDAGLTTAAGAAELATSAAALYAALPVMRGVYRIIEGLL